MTDSSDGPAIGKHPSDANWLTRAASGVGRGARAVGRGAKVAWLERQRAIAALNGVVGDTLAERQSSLALKMALLAHDGACVVDEVSDRVALGDIAAARSACVFLHGNCDSERTWWRSDYSYGAGLRDDLGFAPLYLRYNSGLHVSQCGRVLATLLDRMVAAHGGLDELVLVGHSMGGLVIRSACYYGAEANAPWVDRVRRVVFLGVPHDGAHLERVGRLTTMVLSLVPNLTTRLIAGIGEMRSAGIKDLRHGYLLDEEWADGAERLLPTARRDVPPLPGVDYFIGAGTLADDPEHWSARAFGDGMVHPASAVGERWAGRGLDVPTENVRVFPGTSHMGLVHSQAVYEQLLDWLRR